MEGLIIALLLVLIAIGIAILVVVLKSSKQEKDHSIDSYIEIIQGFSEQLREYSDRSNSILQNHMSSVVKLSNELLGANINELAKVDRENSNSLREQLLGQINELRNNVMKSLQESREESNKQLDKMRQIVDKTLVDTLEERLGKSYGIISQRLEAVARGLGEVQQLATGVSDLKKVLTNVKTRGVWGEVMLGKLLEQMLTSDQYKSQFMIEGSEQVDFAVILPGKHNDKIYLPIDAKFPDASYQKLIDNVDKPADYEAAAKDLINDLKKEAKSISTKYIKPPHTTDFAIMYLPTEGLFAEAVKREGLVEELQNKHRVMVAGPTTLAALLSSLQMGFKTLAIEKRSMEIRDLLITFKMEFVKFTDLLEQTQKRMNTASKSIEDATRKTRTISKKLSQVESITDTEDEDLLNIGIDE